MAILSAGWSLWETLLTTAFMLIVTLPKVDNSSEDSPAEKPSADWRAAADRLYDSLVSRTPPWYTSLFQEIRDCIRSTKLPPLELTSKPVAVHELDIPPWYTSLFREIRDRIRPPKLPPLQLTSKPVEVSTELRIPPWYASVVREIRDRIRPPKLPPLQLTSKALAAKALWDEQRFGSRALPLSLAIHGIGLALLVGIQIAEMLTREVVFTPIAVPSRAVLLLPPPPPGPPAPPPLAAPVSVRISLRALQFPVNPRTPKAAVVEAPALPGFEGGVPGGVVGGVPGGIIGGVPGGVVGGVIGEFLSQIPAPPPPPPPAEAAAAQPEPPPPRRIEVRSDVQQAKLIEMVYPKFSPLAKRARIQGTVRLRAVITKEGTVSEVQVLKGHPLLVDAAMEAVTKWRYQPTLMQGIPVEVLTFIDVNFVLADL